MILIAQAPYLGGPQVDVGDYGRDVIDGCGCTETDLVHPQAERHDTPNPLPYSGLNATGPAPERRDLPLIRRETANDED